MKKDLVFIGLVSALLFPTVGLAASPLAGTWRDTSPIGIGVDSPIMAFTPAFRADWLIGQDTIQKVEAYGVNADLTLDEFNLAPDTYQIVDGSTLAIVHQYYGGTTSAVTAKYQLSGNDLYICYLDRANDCSSQEQFAHLVRSSDTIVIRKGQHGVPQAAAQLSESFGSVSNGWDFEIAPYLPVDFLDPINSYSVLTKDLGGGYTLSVKFAMLGADEAQLGSYDVTFTIYDYSHVVNYSHIVAMSPIMPLSETQSLSYSTLLNGVPLVLKMGLHP